jgi:putative beta-barrel porin BBP2
MIRSRLLTAAALLIALGWPAVAAAQTSSDDPAERARFRFGPVAVQPRVSMNNIGFDTNVFNAAVAPQRDFTATFVPGADAWLRVGLLRLTSKTGVQLVYFDRTSTQRSMGWTEHLRLDVLFRRIRPFVGGERSNMYDRPNPEIDSRVRHHARSLFAGVSFRATPRLTLEMQSTVSLPGFTDDPARGSLDLARQLNRRTITTAFTTKLAPTPLTTFVVRVEQQQDRFEHNALRNADSLGVLPGLELKPRALISGGGHVGFRRFVPVSAAVPGFTGIVGDADVKYVWREMTRFAVQVNRNVDYSFDSTQPYFLQTAVALTVTQLVYGMWDCVGQLSNNRLAYRQLLGADSAVIDGRVDRASLFGFGVGYHLGDGARIGFDVTHHRRQSVLAERRYEGYRFGGSFTYGY